MSPHESPLGDEATSRAEAGRANIERRWAPYRAARIAAGLPPTKGYEKGRPSPFLDADQESFWLAEALRLGLGDETTHRTTLRRIARRLADTETARIDSEQTAGDDDALLQAYYEREVERWTASAARHTTFARMHARYADETRDKLRAFTLRRERGAE